MRLQKPGIVMYRNVSDEAKYYRGRPESPPRQNVSSLLSEDHLSCCNQFDHSFLYPTPGAVPEAGQWDMPASILTH